MSTLKTLKLFENDIVITDGVTEVLYDEEALAQILANKIKLWKGEWLIDVTQGIDYLGILNSKIFFKDRFFKAIRQILLADTRVTKVIALDVTFDRDTATLTGNFSVNTIYGTVAGTI
jgi:hypothetical protein